MHQLIVSFNPIFNSHQFIGSEAMNPKIMAICIINQ